MAPPVALTVAGSDCSGAAGLQADLPTFAALGVHGAAAVTAVTAQTSTGVEQIEVVSAELVRAQIDAVLRDLPVTAVKTGLLLTPAQVEAVADALSTTKAIRVVDPVMVDSSARRFVAEETIAAYRAAEFLQADVLTPNLPEAAILAGTELHTVDDVMASADALRRLAPLVVVTGGRLGDDKAVDVLIHDTGVDLLEAPRVTTENVRGSGCTFAAAITAYVARGHSPVTAVTEASAFARARIALGADWDLTVGRGPVAHLLDPPVHSGDSRG